jgi:transposase-like protein
MQIVVECGPDPQTYLAHFENIARERPAACPRCQTAGRLIGHGFRPRKALAADQAFPLRIRRWRCKACGVTISMLPSFLLCHRWYLLAVIQACVLARLEGHASWREVSAACAVAGAPSLRTLKRWCRALAQQAPAWLAAILVTLAAHDPAAPLLDALGPAAEKQAAPAALLAATLHLLAWAKTRWAELARYGLNDRLRFLWHWGYARGLARLI